MAAAAARLFALLFSTAAMLLAARLVGAAGGFGVQLLLARLLPAGALGLYFAGASLAMVAAVIAAGGYNSIATRFVARYRGRRPALLQAFVRQAQRSTLLASLLAAAAIVAWAALWPGLAADARLVFALAAASIPPLAWVRLHGSFATAIRAFKLAYLPDVSLKPLVVLAVLAALAAAGVALSAWLATAVLTAATALLAAAQYGILGRYFPADLAAWWRPAAAPRPALSRTWRREARTLILVALFTQYFADIAILAATPVLAPAELGRFGLAMKLAFLIGFFVQLGQQIATPDIADSLRASRTTRGLDRRLRLAAWTATAMTLAATVGAAAWGDRLLGFFGADYAGAAPALAILVAAQVLRAAFGPGTAVLTLLGRQMLNLRLAALALAVLIAATAALGALAGTTGAAIAVFAATLVWCGASAHVLNRDARIRVDAFRLRLDPA